MRHEEAVAWLADYARGTVPGAMMASLEHHVLQCGACTDWLGAYRLLEAGLTDAEPTTAHPDEELLALCVTRPEELDEPDHLDLREHLLECADCRRDLEIVRAAVAEARPSPSWSPAPEPNARVLDRVGSGGGLRAGRLLVAAACLAVLLGYAGLRFDWAPRASEGAGGNVEASADRASELVGTNVAGLQLEGFRLIAGERTLRVSNVQVHRGAHVRFRADEVVRFGDGFRITDGGSIAVEVTGGIATQEMQEGTRRAR